VLQVLRELEVEVALGALAECFLVGEEFETLLSETDGEAFDLVDPLPFRNRLVNLLGVPGMEEGGIEINDGWVGVWINFIFLLEVSFQLLEIKLLVLVSFPRHIPGLLVELLLSVSLDCPE